MAVKAAYEVTITDETDVLALVTWYALTSSATAPTKPSTTTTSASVPSPWTTSEPSFNPANGTRYLYTCIQTRWKDGTCTWDNNVQLSSSYEQAKQAWNKANAAQDTANAAAASADAAAITQSDSGKRSIVTEDAADLPLIDLTAYGESVQDGTPTPDAPVYVQAIRGRNLVDVPDKSGTQTNYWWGFSLHYKISPGMYTLSFDGESSTGVRQTTPGLSGGDTDSAGYSYDLPIVASGDIGNRKWVTFTVTQNAVNTKGPYISVRFARQSTSTTITASVSNIQLEYGTVLHDYIPYGHINVESIGKNLIKFPYQTGSSTNNGITWTVNQDGTIIANGTSTSTAFIILNNATMFGEHEPGTYTISGSPNVTGCRIRMQRDNGSGGAIAVDSNAGSSATFTVNYPLKIASGNHNLFCMIESGVTVNNVVFRPQIETGSTEATDYEPYEEHVSYLDLKGQELHGLDETYRDILTIDADRHAVIEKRTKCVHIDKFDSGNSFEGLYGLPDGRVNALPSEGICLCEKLAHSSSSQAQFVTETNVVKTCRTSSTDQGMVCHVRFDGTETSLATYNATLASLGGIDLYYELDESAWYTVDLGYVDLPQVTDGGTVYVASEVQPVIDGSWWTKAGYSVGKLAQQTKISQGSLESPYTEVEWVESDGTQYVYLDWKPPIATWGFEADFIIRNAFNTTQPAWHPTLNVNGAGILFGTQNSSNNNDIQVGSYGSAGFCRIGGTAGGSASTYNAQWKTDGSRQTIKLHGTTLTCANGSTVSVTRASEVSEKPYCNMAVFCYHVGLRRSTTGSLAWPSTARIYSLKFFDGDNLEVDLVGAVRKRDGVTGLYDKVTGHFYPAEGMSYGNAVGNLGEPDTVAQAIAKNNCILAVDNRDATRLWHATASELEKLEDGQKVTVTFVSAVTNSVQTTALAGWDDTTSNSNVYLKLTLADGTVTDWIPCYYSQGGRLTSHYGAGTPVLLTYRENVMYNRALPTATTGSGTPVMRAWYADPNYVDGNTTYTKYSDAVIAGKNGLKPYTLCMKDDAGNWTTIVNQAATGLNDKTCYTGGLQLGGITYHITNGTYAAGANGGQLWESYGGIDFRRDVNGITDNASTTTLQLRKPVYFVGTLDDDDGLFYLDTTKWWTQDSFTTGKVYVLVGHAYTSNNAIFLAANNPSYIWNGTKLVEMNFDRITTAETSISEASESISSLDNYVRGYSYVPTEDSTAKDGVVYYAKSTADDYTIANVSVGESVSGLYTYSNGTWTAASGTAQAGVDYFQKVQVDVYEESSVAVGASVSGLYVLDDSGSLSGTISAIGGDVETLQGDVGDIQLSVSALDDSVEGIQTNVGALQTDVGNVQTSLTALEEDHGAIASEWRRVVKIDNENGKVLVGYKDENGNFRGGRTETNANGFDVIMEFPDPQNQNQTIEKVVAHYGESAQIGSLDGTHIIADGDTLMFLPAGAEPDIANAVAYIDIDPQTQESVFYMTRSVVVKDMFLGEGKWKFFKRENNNLSLKWMGDM